MPSGLCRLAGGGRRADDGSVSSELRRTDHTGITVSDLDRAVAFWCDVLGVEVERRAHLTGTFAEDVVGVPGADIRTAIIPLPGHRLELLEYVRPGTATDHAPGPDTPGAMHLAFVVEDLDALLARVAEGGWTAPGRPREMADGPRAGTRFVYVRDPDGTTVEFIEEPRPAA